MRELVVIPLEHMETFVLTITKTEKASEPYNLYTILGLINHELRIGQVLIGLALLDKAAMLRPEMMPLHIHQNHGIRHQSVSPSAKKHFKRIMPEIINMFPEMATPFMGDIEFHSGREGLEEVRFIQT